MDLLLQDILTQGAFLTRALLMLPLLCLAFLFLKEHRGESFRLLKELAKHGWQIAFLFYLSFMLVSTLLSRSTINPYRSILLHFGFTSDAKWNNEIIENTLLFIPYIPLALTAFRFRRPWLAALILSAGTTVFIEGMQLLLWLGEFQLSDLFHNFIGGMLGCGLWYLAGWIRKKTKARYTADR